MKKLLLFVIATFAMTAFVGCATLYMNESEPLKDNYSQLLPPLVPMMDIQSLENVFGIASSSSTGSSYSTHHVLGTTGMSFNNGYSNTTTYRDPAIQDLTNYFEKDATTNICQQYGTRKGYITCQIVNGYSNTRIGMRWIGAYPFFGIPYLFGMPSKKAQSAFCVRVDIYDSNKNLVGSYTSEYYADKRYVALYYGYSAANAKHKSALEAFKACMADVKDKIRADCDRLNKALH
ncbi:MAG: hypothetical protein RSC12_01650 [Alistipes sp.]